MQDNLRPQSFPGWKTTTPTIEVLGVHRLRVTDQMIVEQARILWGDTVGVEREKALAQCEKQLSSVVLIEAMIWDRDGHFKFSDFTQANEDLPPDSWQVAWAEAYLSTDGKSRLEIRSMDLPKSADLRVAFFFHSWDESAPLRWSYGEITCTRPSAMPSRLEGLVPYVLLD